MVITPILQIEKQKWGDLVVLKIVDYVVLICTNKITSSHNTKQTSRKFIYDSHFHKNKLLIIVSL